MLRVIIISIHIQVPEPMDGQASALTMNATSPLKVPASTLQKLLERRTSNGPEGTAADPSVDMLEGWATSGRGKKMGSDVEPPVPLR